METETEMEMESSADRLEALAKEYPGYDMELLAHLLDNENLRTKYSPEDIKVLFETPSGFVIFGIDSGYLYDIDSSYTGIQTIWVHCVKKASADFFLWRKGFLKLDNKSTAIRPHGIDNSLAELIEKECGLGDILLVGESKYKEAIENNLGIPCRCDEAAEELMWGLQNLLYDFVPEEKSEFGEQDRKYHSRKLLAYLHAIDPDIKPEMMFTEDERKKMLEGVGKYDDEIDRATMREIYKHAVQLNKLKFSKLRKLQSLLGEATAAAREGVRDSEEVPQVSSSNRSGQEEEGAAEGDDGQRKKLKVDDGGGD